jgi:hypothetical protein
MMIHFKRVCSKLSWTTPPVHGPHPPASQKITLDCLLIGSHQASLQCGLREGEQRGRMTSGGDIEYQFILEIGFLLEEPGNMSSDEWRTT